MNARRFVDIGLSFHDRTVRIFSGKRDVSCRHGNDLSAYPEHFSGKLDRLGFGAQDVGERHQQQVANIVPLEPRPLVEAIQKQLAEEVVAVLSLCQSGERHADISHRQITELVAQAPGASAGICHRDDRGERNAVIGILLQPREHGIGAGAAAENHDILFFLFYWHDSSACFHCFR